MMNQTFCSTCERSITKGQKQITCQLCYNAYHVKTTCVFKSNIGSLKSSLDLSNSFVCYQCLESTFPFHSLNNNDLRETIKNLSNNQTERNIDRLNELIFNPFEVLNDCSETPGRMSEHFDQSAPQLQINNRYYTSGDFSELIKNNNSHQEQLSFLHLNIRSLRSKTDDFYNYLKILNFDFSIIALTETWLKDDADEIPQVPEYKTISLNRKNKDGGGVCLFVKTNFKFKIRTDLNEMQSNSDTTEMLFIEIIRPQMSNIIVGVIYRPPENNYNEFEQSLNNLLYHIDKEKKTCYLLGDFNLDLLKYENSEFSNRFFNQLSSSDFLPLITKPTRITSHTATLIDNIFCNHVQQNQISGILFNDLSDHLPIFQICLGDKGKLRKKNAVYYKTRVMSEDKMTLFSEDLNKQNWDPILTNTDAEQSYKAFKEVFNTIYNKYFPIITIKHKDIKRKGNKWITQGLIKSTKTKEKLHKKFLRKPTLTNRSKYKNYRNKLNHLIRVAKRTYYHNRIDCSKSDLKATWKIINELLNNKRKHSKLPTVFQENGTPIENPIDISDKFNKFFVNVGPNLAKSFDKNSKDFYKHLKGDYTQSMILNDTSEEEILTIIRNMKPKYSSGIDEVSPKLLKHISNTVSSPLCHIFNLTFRTGIIPSDLKASLVTPIYKTDDETQFTNYRPISVLTSFAKVLEKVMYQRLISYITKKNILYEKQYGFRNKHSTILAMIDLVDKITKAIEEGTYTVGVFLDLSKAFDTVNHKILLAKLSYYGIRGICHDWFENYLKNRRQIVKFNDVKSSEEIIRCGVPQGSVLGPLLFLLYINDIHNCSDKLSFILFADDTNVFYSNKNLHTLETTINNELSKVQNWLNDNKLTLNIKKTHYILFKSHRRKCDKDIPLEVNNQKVMKVKQTKFLGTFIDEHLTWRAHIDYISTKLSRICGILCKVRSFLNRENLITLYNTLVYPHLNYGNIIWANNYKTRFKKLVTLQKKILRIITFSSYTTSSLPIYQELNILNIDQINKLQLCLFTYDLFNNRLPPQFNSFCSTNNRIHKHYTRNSTKLHKQYNKTNYGLYSTRNMCINMWNSLPITLTNCHSHNIFKRNLKLYLLSCNK